jgi:hypothetical protein
MKTIIRETRLENLSIPELAETAGQDWKEYILYTYSHPGKYSRHEDYGYRNAAQKDIKYYVSTWYKEED